jgi:RNA polymerase sigma factor (sigma-70 family)
MEQREREAELGREIQDDRELVRRCQTGDRKAKGDLVRRHVEQVRRTLHRIVGPTQDLPDLVQTTFLEVLRSLSHYRGDALLRTWIDRVCAHVAYQHLRRRRRPQPVSLELVTGAAEEVLGSSGLADSGLQGRRLTNRLSAVLDGLDPRKRVALILHAVLGYSVEEVAIMTNSWVSTTKSRILYGRRELLKRARRDPELRAWLEDAAGGPLVR